MNKRRKHRVVVEVTTNHALPERSTVRCLNLLFSQIDFNRKPISGRIYIDKLTAKSYKKVITSERIKETPQSKRIVK